MKRLGYAQTIAALLVVFAAATAIRAELPLLDVLSAWGGPVNAVDVAPGGNIAYVGAGRRVVVLDISDVSHITELSSVDMVQTVKDVEHRDGYLYVATETNPYRFAVVDVSNPRDAHLVWTTPLSIYVGTPVNVELRSHYAYVGTGTDLWVYDITKPNAVQFLGRALDTIVQDAVIVGDLAYVAAGQQGSSAGLSIYDLSAPDPLNPALVGSINVQLSGLVPPMRLAVNGDRAYLTHKPDLSNVSLAIIDVSTPSSPSVINDSPLAPGLPGAKYITDVDAAGTHVYATMLAEANEEIGIIATWPAYPGLMIFDVGTAPDLPMQVASYKDHAGVHGVRVFESRVFLYDQGEGLVVLDVSTPANPVRLGNYHSPAFLGRMAKVGNLLYVSDYWNGLTILDIADPSVPTVSGVYQTPLGPSGQLFVNHWGIAVKGTRAFVAAGEDSVHVIDVADPGSPVLVQKLLGFPASDAWRSVAMLLRDNLLHVAFENEPPTPPGTDSRWRLRTYDLAQAGYPVLSTFSVGSELLITPRVLAATSASPTVFCGSEHDPTHTIDVSVPTAPVMVYEGAQDVYDEAYDVAVEGSLWVGAAQFRPYPFAAEGVYFTDVSDPAKPMPLAFVHGRETNAVALRNNRAYGIGDFNVSGPGGVPAGIPGLPFTVGSECAVFDVSAPRTPVPIAWAPYVGGVRNGSMLVDERQIFVATAAANDMTDNKNDDQGLIFLGLPHALCMADVTDDWTVNIDDLLAVINNWGQMGSNAADVTGNGVVGIDDLLAVINAWGACK
jgi:hypothetical protein